MLRGLHHVTALAGDPLANLDFYTNFAGLRLIKRTVNFDDPATYHFYFAPEPEPGRIATFFPWPSAPAGRDGSGRIRALAFAVPQNTIDAAAAEQRFSEPLITTRDPAGLAVERVALAVPTVRLHSVTLAVADPDRTGRFLTDLLGFRFLANEGDRGRFELAGSFADVIAMPGDRAKLGPGMVHHVAWRASGDEELNQWREKLKSAGVHVTRVIDRKYFRSIYFREPGGVLFEIATEEPGFLIDEPAGRLGRSLQLPPWLEPLRESIERRLPPLKWSADLK